MAWSDEHPEWYSPKEFNFCKRHMRWAIRNLVELEEGRWPTMPANHVKEIQDDTVRAEGITAEMREYELLMKRSGGHVPAKFERAVEISSEIHSRLDRCNAEGWHDGAMLVDLLLYQKTDKAMHQSYGLDMETRSDRMERALVYISGWKAKGVYRKWCEVLEEKRKREEL